VIRRRQFLTLLGGAAAAWPLATRAQQAAMPVIGYLDAGSALERTAQVAALRKGLAEGGYHVGQNVALEFHWAEGQYGRFPELAADFARRKVSVIVTQGSGVAALAAKAATSTIPIVFGVGGDPVKQGLVASLNRPGGNATGVNFFTAELVAKRMQLLRELVPAAKRVAVLLNPTDPEGYGTLADAEAAADGRQVLVREVTSGRDIDAAFASMTREQADAVLVAPGTFFNTRRVQLAILAARHALPAIYPVRAYAEVGGRFSSGRHLYRSCPERRQTGGPSGSAVDEIRAGDQPQHHTGSRPRRATDAARPRR